MNQGVTSYPVDLDIDSGVLAEIIAGKVGEKGDLAKSFQERHIFSKVDSEVLLLEHLKSLFGAEKTKTIIQSLIARAKV